MVTEAILISVRNGNFCYAGAAYLILMGIKLWMAAPVVPEL